jgi:CheY-like chemotaxis protein
MNKILVVDYYTKTSQLYALSLEAYVGASVVETADVAEAIDFVKDFMPTVIIVRGMFDQRDVGQKMYNILKEGNIGSHLIVLGKTSLSYQEALLLEEDVDVKTLIKQVASILGVTAKEMASRNVGEFYPFKLKSLFPKLQLVCDLYLKSIDGEFKVFLKKGTILFQEMITFLEFQNQIEIFVKAEERLKFTNAIMIHLLEFMAQDELTVQESIILSNQAFLMVREAAVKLQITPEIIMMTESNINTVMSIVNKLPKLNELLETITNSTDDNFKHSLLISYVCNHIIDNIEWGTQEQKVKLTFVAFFHNIALPSEHILINSVERLEEAKLDEKVKARILNHPIVAAKIVDKYKSGIPLGVDAIIKQHHGSRSGVGFSQSPQSISPLALVFLIADEWVTNLMISEKQNYHLSHEALLAIIKNKYRSLSYQKIIKSLEKLV